MLNEALGLVDVDSNKEGIIMGNSKKKRTNSKIDEKIVASSTTPNKISFVQAKELIVAGKDINPELFDFDISTLDIGTKYDSHDSSSYENWYTTTTRSTLLHIAIQCQNICAVDKLLKAGIDKEILKSTESVREQRQIDDSSGMFACTSHYGEMHEVYRRTSDDKTQEIAQRTNNPHILALLAGETIPAAVYTLESMAEILSKHITAFQEVNGALITEEQRSKLINSLYKLARITDRNAEKENFKNKAAIEQWLLRVDSSLKDSKSLKINELKPVLQALMKQVNIFGNWLDELTPKEVKNEPSEDLSSIESDGTSVDELTNMLASDKIDVSKYLEKTIKFQDNKGRAAYGIPAKDLAQRVERKWLRRVTEKFLRVGRPMKPNSQSNTIYNRIREHLANNANQPFVVDGLVRRSFLIALSKILSKDKQMPNINFRLGVTDITFSTENSYTYRQMGNFKMEFPSKYDLKYGAGLIARIQYLLGATWEKANINRKQKLLTLMRGKLNQLSPFDVNEVNNYGNIKLEEDASFESLSGKKEQKTAREKQQSSVHLLNAWLFLVSIVEVLVRLYRDEEGNVHDYDDKKGSESDSLPIAVAQARSLLLLMGQKISFTDFMGESKCYKGDAKLHRARYGIVTGRNTIDNLDVIDEKFCRLNALFNQAAIKSEVKEEYFADNPAGTAAVIQGRSTMYRNLSSVYGIGDNESDSEDSAYSDEEDSDLSEIIICQPGSSR